MKESKSYVTMPFSQFESMRMKISEYEAFLSKLRNCFDYNDVESGGVVFFSVQDFFSLIRESTFILSYKYKNCGISLNDDEKIHNE